MASIADHIGARNDNDLLARFVAAAEIEGIPNAQQFAERRRGELVSADIGGTTIADVHAYAVATYEPTPRPGANPAAVTDDQIIAAVQALYAEDQASTEPTTGV